MMNKIFYISLIFTSLLLGSCEKEIEIELPEYEEKLVIEGRIEEGMPPIVFLSKSQDYFDETNQETFANSYTTDAVVTVTEGSNEVQLDILCSSDLPPEFQAMLAGMLGIDASVLQTIDVCGFVGLNNQAIWGEVGKTYHLKVEYQGETYTSTTSIVEPLAPDSVYFKLDGNDTRYGYAYATITDPGGVLNAYRWQARRINQVDGEDEDPSFKTPFGSAFDDEFFDGLTFEFGFPRPTDFDEDFESDDFGYYEIGDSVAVKFNSVDYDAAKVIIKVEAQAFTAGNPFAAPADVPTNIEGGALGFWVGYSSVIDTLVAE